jgi:hypothetical protein
MKFCASFMVLFFFSLAAFAEAKKVAIVKILRGEVDVLTLGKTTKLKVQDWVEDGAVVKTGDKSFVKLVFIDKSQMNVGPNSEMKIEKFNGQDSGVIDLVKGKVRSQVSKDYLQIKDRDSSKLFIKTPNAVMGIRGTDFMISTNGKNTAAILFEGEVVFNRLESRGVTDSRRLEEMVDRGVRMYPGEFSVVEQNRIQPTVPALLNLNQREVLEKNDTFDSRSPSSTGSEEVKKSIVPEGLNGQIVGNDSSVLSEELKQVANQDKSNSNVPSSSVPEGYVAGDKVKPANGSFVHVESGVIIPPGNDSVLDKNSNTFIPGAETGKVGADGSFVPPKNVEITDDGKIMVTTSGNNGEKKITEIPKPVPIISYGSQVGGPMGIAVHNLPPKDAPMINPNDPANKNASGGVINVNEAAQQIYNGPKLRNFNIQQQ